MHCKPVGCIYKECVCVCAGKGGGGNNAKQWFPARQPARVNRGQFAVILEGIVCTVSTLHFFFFLRDRHLASITQVNRHKIANWKIANLLISSLDIDYCSIIPLFSTTAGQIYGGLCILHSLFMCVSLKNPLYCEVKHGLPSQVWKLLVCTQEQLLLTSHWPGLGLLLLSVLGYSCIYTL